jgi:hypothetical protein
MDATHVLALQRLVGNRAVARLLAPSTRSLARSLSTDLIDARTSWVGDLDESALAEDLLGWAKYGDVDLVQTTLDDLSATDRDDVAVALCEAADEADLQALVADSGGRALLDRLFDEITSGSIGDDEQRQADRIMGAKSSRISPEDFAEGAQRAKVFPYRLSGLTVLDDAPLHAERRGEGKIWVRQPVRVLGTSMFRDETQTLPDEAFIGGIELPEDEVVGVRLYDLGGTVIYRPALILVQLSNENTTATLTKIAEIAGIGLTLGTGALAGLGVEATMMARVALWADRAAFALGTLASVIREHRGEIIARFGADGRTFLRYVDLVQSATALYGFARVVLAMGQLVAGLRSAYGNVRTVGDVPDEIATSTDEVLQQADEIAAARTSPVDGADGPGGAGASGAGLGGGGDDLPPAPQNVLVVGAERADEFAYADDLMAHGQQVTVVNPSVTDEAQAFAERGGNFVRGRVEDLPEGQQYTMIREDFPFPLGRAFQPTAEFATARLDRLAPGGRWVVVTESSEFSATLEATVIGRPDLKVTNTEIPLFHEGTPRSDWPREARRFVLIFEPRRRPLRHDRSDVPVLTNR